MHGVARQQPELSMEAATLSLQGRTPLSTSSTRPARSRVFLTALLVGVCYYCAARIGGALAFPSAPVSALWAPNAILLAALVLARRGHWWIYLLMVLPFQFLAQLPSEPLSRVVIQYLANAAEALIGAYAL